MTVTTERAWIGSAGDRGEEDRAAWLRLAMALAILSVAIISLHDTMMNLHTGRLHLVAATAGIAVAAALALGERTSQAGLVLFSVSIGVYVADKWALYHNHGWLAVWSLGPAMIFGARWWESADFRWYLRMTLGVVMLGAAAQKLIAGTYLDGSFIGYMSLHGSETEWLFGFLCGPTLAESSCLAHAALGTFLVLWQIAVGALLLAGVTNRWFLFVEIAFLLGAGVYADEMNFQALNIALFCIAFGYGTPPKLAGLVIALLVLDMVKISNMVAFFL